MPERVGWSREQLIIALKLYCEMPFGKMHQHNPEIKRYADLIGRSASALAMKMTNFASLDPAITATGRKGLPGASKTDKAMWEEMASNWNAFANEIQAVELDLGAPESSAEVVPPEDVGVSYEGLTKEATIQVRVGQSFFRKAVLSAYEYKCCITGLSIPELLVASHIVPWRVDSSNRLNPRNGLCLSAMHDRAFDAGLIAISDDHRVLISKKVTKTDEYAAHTFIEYVGKPISLPEKFVPAPQFLKHHREVLFSNSEWMG
jgi:putative restriction endonuclease